MEWLTTGRIYEPAQQAMSKLHLVEARKIVAFADTKHEKDISYALCGVSPSKGWHTDLFLRDPCLNCYRIAEKRGLEIPEAVAGQVFEPHQSIEG